MGRALIMCIIYLWSRKFMNVQQTFYFGITFQGMYLPWVLCAFELLLGGVPVQYFVSVMVVWFAFDLTLSMFVRLAFLWRTSTTFSQRLPRKWDIRHFALPFSCTESFLLSITPRLEFSTSNNGNVRHMHGGKQEPSMSKNFRGEVNLGGVRSVL